MSSQSDLVSALKAIADEHWNTKQLPILLSNVPRLLEFQYPDLDRKKILGNKSLKSLIKETEEAAGYRLIEHPIQTARVGLLPRSAVYEFPSEETNGEHHVIHANSGNKRAALAFFKALSSLNDKELEKINIPVSVIVKLFQ